jgi:peptidoglycan/xylan/chitin deacetylase (PgdA/CDA1 family)
MAELARMATDVALTFDDGPGAVTGALLDVLARHGAHATFYWLGSLVAGNEVVMQRAAAEGHEIGVHGWTHVDHRDDPVGRAAEVARTAQRLEAVCGVRPRRFRPPYGSTNAALEAAVAAQGLETVLWDVDPRDWEDPGADAIVERTLAALRPGAVVLLHERPGTVAAVDRLLSERY